jgi:uncharacterized repeat protein (TIGR01451 family)
MKTHSKPILALVLLSLVAAVVISPASRPAQAAGTWYVVPPPTGSDGNDCLTPSAPCGTINGAIGKAASGDTIKVAVGTYTGTGNEVVLINKNITLSGGWDTGFASQNGMSTIDGGGARRGVTVSGISSTVERFSVQNGNGYGSGEGGGGIANSGTLTLTTSIVTGNSYGNTCCTGGGGGGGIFNRGTLVLLSSTVSGNFLLGGFSGAGIENFGSLASLTMVNSTVSDNSGGEGIYSFVGTVNLANSTVTSNGTHGVHNIQGAVTLRNSILEGCYNNLNGYFGTITSLGYNLVPLGGTGCTLLSSDLTSVDIRLGLLQDNGSPIPTRALLPGSPAINVGNPSGCTDHLGNPLPLDQRGAPRVGRCDIGAYEAGLSISKQVSGAPRAGGTATYIVNLVNLGGSIDLTNVTLTDTLPSGLTYVPNSLSATNGTGMENQGVVTWTGTVLDNAPTVITFSTSVTTTLDLVVTNTAISGWAGITTTSSVSFDTTPRLYLPLLFNQYCPPTFFDDFSNSYSGWPVGEDDLVRVEYLGGEYRILSKNGDYIYLFRSPACARQNYTVEMDARWVGGTGDSYGLLFGITGGFSQYYLFDINTDYRMYRLYRRDPSEFRPIAPVTYSAAIRGGTSSNHLKVTRNSAGIWLEVNGTALGVWADATITGSTWAGLMSNPYIDVPVSDARFDNFSVTTLQATGTAVETGSQNIVTAEVNTPALTSLSIALPPELEWKLPEKSIPQERK